MHGFFYLSTNASYQTDSEVISFRVKNILMLWVRVRPHPQILPYVVSLVWSYGCRKYCCRTIEVKLR
jgi:hypothetical protein